MQLAREKCIAAERKAWDSLLYVMHNPENWEQKPKGIAKLLEVDEAPIIIIC